MSLAPDFKMEKEAAKQVCDCFPWRKGEMGRGPGAVGVKATLIGRIGLFLLCATAGNQARLVEEGPPGLLQHPGQEGLSRLHKKEERGCVSV